MVVKHRRFAVLGSHGAGKTAIMSQFVNQVFIETYDPTIANDFHKSIQFHGNTYALDLIDSAGMSDCSYLPENLCYAVDGWILIYSVTSEESFKTIKYIYSQLYAKTGLMGQIPIVLVANKVDLTTDRVVSSFEGKELAKKWGVAYVETSAKQNTNICNIFNCLLKKHEKMTTPKKKPKLLSCAF